jgi:FkbM family methyltransferase
MEHVVELDVPAAGRLKIHTHAEGDPYISGCLRMGNIFEPHILTVLAAFLKPGDRFLDVGANIGWFAMIGSRLVSPSGQVYALEPDPDNHRLLRENLATNECYNVKHWRCAAGSQSRQAMLSRSSTNRGDHRVAVREITGDTTPVKVRAVDRLLWWNRRVDVALIDTQGSEVNVFRGMRSILRRSPKIRIIFEYWPHGLESCGCSVKELAAIVQEHGWRMWLLEPETPPQEIRANDLVLLAQDRFTPASERHADVAALSPHDTKGIDFMRRLWRMDRSVAAKEWS